MLYNVIKSINILKTLLWSYYKKKNANIWNKFFFIDKSYFSINGLQYYLQKL